VQKVFIETGRSVRNSVCESFNGTLRADCLNRKLFLSVSAAQCKLDDYRRESHEERAPSSLGISTAPRDCEKVMGKYVRKEKYQENLHIQWC
jgi:putative transposase